MSKSAAWQLDLLRLVFQNIDAPAIGDAGGLRGSQQAGNLYLSLHTDDPGKSGNQETNETNYAGYGRMAVPRSPAGFTVSSEINEQGDEVGKVNPAANIDFAKCGSSGPSITHWAVGIAEMGAGKRLYSGPVTPNIPVVEGYTIPRLEISTKVTEE
jgi:hypothetical protein